jgi:hypothetical protein
MSALMPMAMAAQARASEATEARRWLRAVSA